MKQRHQIEVLNDLNGEVVNFYRMCKDRFEELQEMINLTPHSRSLHDDAAVIYNNPHLFTELQRAWAVWILATQGFASGIDNSWAYARAENTCEKKTHNARLRFTREYADRLDRVQIECRDALKVIRSRDCEHSFFYVDPPYVGSHCGHYEGYTEHDWQMLLDTLGSIKGKFLLSSYPGDALTEAKKKYNWHTIQFEKGIAVTRHTKRRKIEVLTANYYIE